MTQNLLLDYQHPNQINIGDYIQSIAAKQFYPKIDNLIPRDQLSKIQTPSRAIINGFYRLNDNNHFSKHLYPLATSIHIANPREFESFAKTIEYWSTFGPIGCRDLQTKELLNKHGFEAYFSGCLTASIKLPPPKKKKIS